MNANVIHLERSNLCNEKYLPLNLLGCNCSGKSTKCFFDQELYVKTGHGGHCVECEDNTIGVHCEFCKEGFFLNENQICTDCECNPVGSESLQCGLEGKCKCKQGVTGSKCDRCIDGYFGLGPEGCQTCNCSSVGALDDPPKCDALNGRCICKINVEGPKCDRLNLLIKTNF